MADHVMIGGIVKVDLSAAVLDFRIRVDWVQVEATISGNPKESW